jgi:hypothetical protein
LPASIGQKLVSEGPASEGGIEMGAVGSLDEHSGAAVDTQFTSLEPANKGKLLLLERPKNRKLA